MDFKNGVYKEKRALCPFRTTKGQQKTGSPLNQGLNEGLSMSVVS